jgi:hypothetical protein
VGPSRLVWHQGERQCFGLRHCPPYAHGKLEELAAEFLAEGGKEDITDAF